MKRRRTDVDSWLAGEILLSGLLGASLALLIAYPVLRTEYDLPALRLVLQTTMALAGLLVALLAAVRFSVEGRRTDLLLAAGFLVGSLSTAVFAVGPVLGGGGVQRREAWAALLGTGLGQALAAAAPFVGGRSRSRGRAIADTVAVAGAGVVLSWALVRWAGPALPALVPRAGHVQPFALTVTLGVQALTDLVAVAGWGRRFVRRGDDLFRWLALAFTLQLFAALHEVFTPLHGTTYIVEGDFLRLLAFGVMLVGVWRAIRAAEFGRAVAEERARVAREIHDGLAQYLFAISTDVRMLEAGAPFAETVPRLKEASTLAQQEARFAVLALSSASGTAPFDTALRRYVEFLAADGALEVELEIDSSIRLAPDEQIEIFRIVQEGLGNVRRHSRARRAEVTIGRRPSGERFVTVRDDGDGFDGEDVAAGQGLRNMRSRAASIEGGFTLRTAPGRGTALEVVLR